MQPPAPKATQLVSIACVVAHVLVATSQARTWRVRVDGTGDAATIPAALDSARAGDEIVLEAGVYAWSTQGHDADPSDASMLRIVRAVTLRGESGAALTVLDAEGQGRVVRCVDAGAVRLDGLSLTGGVAGGAGGALWCEGATQPTVVGCVVRANRSGDRAAGGGVSCRDGDIRDSEFLDNTTGIAGFGGGLHAVDSQIVGCRFARNVARGGDAGGGAGGGLWSQSSVVQSCAFDSNRAEGTFTGSGGGLYENGVGSVSASTFVGNVARGIMNQGLGGGLYAFGGGSIEHCVFVGNVAERDGGSGLGGGVYGRRQTTLQRCTLIGNSSGVHTESTVLVEATLVAWNTGVACSGVATWRCSNLFGNGGGDLPCGVSTGGNFSADPQFCAVDPLVSLHVALQSDSPCVAGNHPDGMDCGRIGAADVGCETVTTTPTTWGRVKSLYR